uniref:Mitochondrial inner membrane protease subunit n=1 Tax=Trieres chinensis TaxID=1514140 RepID=A0A7S2AA40_TRICV
MTNTSRNRNFAAAVVAAAVAAAALVEPSQAFAFPVPRPTATMKTTTTIGGSCPSRRPPPAVRTSLLPPPLRSSSDSSAEDAGGGVGGEDAAIIASPWYRRLFDDFTRASRDGFGTRARNVATTLAVGDVVVPLCGDLERRQELANRGLYAGVEYEICALNVTEGGGEGEGGGGAPPARPVRPVRPVRTLEGLSRSEIEGSVALVRPAYPLRDHLERSDWPVPIRPVDDVPLWLSRATYEAGTALGTLALCATFLGTASFFALLVRFAYVPTESMVPAVYPGDVVLVTRSVDLPGLRPRAGDVVFFDPPKELDEAIEQYVGNAGAVPTRGKQFLKRVAAVPGESAGVRDSNPFAVVKTKTTTTTSSSSGTGGGGGGGGVVAVERTDRTGPYARPELFPSSSWDRPASPLGRGEYFVAGDNGPRSVDSRVWGPLKDRYIFGTARAVVWPPAHAGPISGGNFVSTEMGEE